MISSKKIQFLLVVILTCIFLPVFAAEPNEPKTALKFETSIETMTWSIFVEPEPGKPGSLYTNPPGPVKPSYVAKLLLHKDYPQYDYAINVMETILKSPIAKKFSKEQDKFFKTELAIRLEDSQRVPFYKSTWLYATGQEDAKLMVQAYIDGLNKIVEEGLSNSKKSLSAYKQGLDKSQKELPEKQKQLKEVERSYQSIKEATHRFSPDGEASDLAQAIIVEMDKTLNALDIELAGIREKLKTIEKYRNEPNLRDKLAEMHIELMIEMSGLEARREITQQIRVREQEFLRLNHRRGNLLDEIRSLNRSIEGSKGRIDSLTNRLNNPTASMRPPKVYQNTVTIYPVLTDNSK